MKSISLKVVPLPVDGKVIDLSYQAQLEAIMKTPANLQHADLTEIRHSLRVLDALETCDGQTLNLEDTDFEYLQKRVLETRWPVIDRAILDFVEDVTNPK